MSNALDKVFEPFVIKQAKANVGGKKKRYKSNTPGTDAYQYKEKSVKADKRLQKQYEADTQKRYKRHGGVDTTGNKAKIIKMKSKLGITYLKKARGPAIPLETWNELFIKYKTGEYSMVELSQLYGIDISMISRKIKEYGVTKNENAMEAIKLFDEGFRQISNIINGENKEERKMIEANAADIMTDDKMGEDKMEIEKKPYVMVNKAQEKDLPVECEVIDSANSVKLANEIMDIVAKRNPQFARGFQAISAIMIQKMKDLLQDPKLSSGDIRNFAQAMKDIDSTMGIFPKQPTIAQQFNFGQKQQQDKVDKDINLKINVVSKKVE